VRKLARLRRSGSHASFCTLWETAHERAGPAAGTNPPITNPPITTPAITGPRARGRSTIDPPARPTRRRDTSLASPRPISATASLAAAPTYWRHRLPGGHPDPVAPPPTWRPARPTSATTPRATLTHAPDGTPADLQVRAHLRRLQRPVHPPRRRTAHAFALAGGELAEIPAPGRSSGMVRGS
jgi:hypothetical protein